MKTLQINGRWIGIMLNVNDGQTLEMAQAINNGEITVRQVHNDDVETIFTIKAKDMVAILNWLKCQHDGGGINLDPVRFLNHKHWTAVEGDANEL